MMALFRLRHVVTCHCATGNMYVVSENLYISSLRMPYCWLHQAHSLTPPWVQCVFMWTCAADR